MNSILSCQNIEKSYHDGNRELKILLGVDLDVREGEILAISGPSGVGKSTLLHMLSGFLAPSAGTVTVLSPNGGESLLRGAVTPIRWSSTGNIGGAVKIVLRRGTGSTIVSSMTANGGGVGIAVVVDGEDHGERAAQMLGLQGDGALSGRGCGREAEDRAAELEIL